MTLRIESMQSDITLVGKAWYHQYAAWLTANVNRLTSLFEITEQEKQRENHAWKFFSLSFALLFYEPLY